MRAFFTIAIVVTMAAVGLGGCFWHHQQAVQTQPQLGEDLNLSISQYSAPAHQRGPLYKA